MSDHLLAHQLASGRPPQKPRKRPLQPERGDENVELKRLKAEEQSFSKLQKRYGFMSDQLVSEIATARFTGLMDKLASCLIHLATDTPKGVVRDISLCGDVDFIPSISSQRGKNGDMGWGCGYRNIQMLCSHLLNVGLSDRTSSSPITEGLTKLVGKNPSLESVQLGIEKAWERGFDKIGAGQLGHKLLNTAKWIGATEVVALLRCGGVRTRIVDFDRSLCPRSHFFEWIKNYFFRQGPSRSSRSSPSNAYHQLCCGRPPLYLQHEGHSRTIVGVIREWHDHIEKDPVMLVFDPAIAGPTLVRAIETNHGWQRLVKREPQTFWQQKFQLVAIDCDLPHITCTQQSHHHPTNRFRSTGDANLSKLIVSEKITCDTAVPS